jgi:FlaA1/EpsC-like NDP-sugar epimerase
MEAVPEEAVKNNVLGCRNMVRMADAAGVETFVLISTDKAVDPSSVMGACKRVAELIVREQAGRSRTRFTSVRFGNVLGSAGSVVPLFASQIASGGPVTVTHPECRRYLMTLQEAVGLVVLAGLRCYGDVSVLEMGEPIRILDLARLMITMAGLVPDKDVRIVFIGLRPGEKLQEQLLTAEEWARSRRVHEAVRAVDSPAPGSGLAHAVDHLESLAARADRAAVVAALAELLPTFKPDGGWGELSAREPPVATA